MEFFAMDVLIPEGHKIKLSLRDIGEGLFTSKVQRLLWTLMSMEVVF